MTDLPTVEPPIVPIRRVPYLAWLFERWPLRTLDTNPAYRLTILVILKVLGLLTLFQLALIVGAPVGRAAWGGQYDVLPTALRIGSVISIVIYGQVLKVALDRASRSSVRVFRRRTTFFVRLIAIYFSVGVVMNLMSGSDWEKYLMAPVALILAICFWRLARTPKIIEDMVHINS